MIPHGNSYQYKKLHHVYVIYDKQDDNIYKYGMSHDLIETDGLSARLRDQLDLFNRIAGWTRFHSEILYYNVSGRVQAREIEQKLIRDHKDLHGHRPVGNLSD